MTPNGQQHASEGNLLRAQRGEMSAFERLVEAHRDEVYSLVLRLALSDAEVAEVVQESFLAAHQQLRSFRSEAEVGGWIRRFAARRALERLDRSVADGAKEQLQSPLFNERGSLKEYPAFDWSRGADQGPISAELNSGIPQAIDRLPRAHREVFLLKDVAGLSYQEIAGITGEAIPNIRSRLHQARLSLREEIDQLYSAARGLHA